MIFKIKKLGKKALILAIFLLFLPLLTNGAQIYILPQNAQIGVGETIIGELRLDTEGENINVVDIEVLFPSEILEIVDVIDGKSILDLWVQKPSFLNSEGKLIVQGGRVGGFSGEGLLLQIIFKGKTLGRGNISYDQSSKILLHDGRGTPTSGLFSGARYTVIEETSKAILLNSETHPNKERWYSEDSIQISWELLSGKNYSYTLSRDVAENPDNKGEEKLSPLEFRDLSDGLYYFSIKESNERGGWSEVVRYRFLQDKTSPEPFEVLIGEKEDNGNIEYFAAFRTTDKTSGVDHYEIRKPGFLSSFFKTGKWEIAQSPYPLTEKKLKDIIEVKAVDKAGNERIESFVPKGVLITGILLKLFVAALLFLAVYSIKKRRRKRILNS